jgi:hypothetical protein
MKTEFQLCSEGTFLALCDKRKPRTNKDGTLAVVYRSPDGIYTSVTKYPASPEDIYLMRIKRAIERHENETANLVRSPTKDKSRGSSASKGEKVSKRKKA